MSAKGAGRKASFPGTGRGSAGRYCGRAGYAAFEKISTLLAPSRAGHMERYRNRGLPIHITRKVIRAPESHYLSHAGRFNHPSLLRQSSLSPDAFKRDRYILRGPWGIELFSRSQIRPSTCERAVGLHLFLVLGLASRDDGCPQREELWLVLYSSRVSRMQILSPEVLIFPDGLVM